MRVKVSYTIDAENISEIIKSIAEQTESNAKKIAEICNELSTSKDYGIKSLNRTTEVKNIAADILEQSTDMEGILSGLLTSLSAPAPTPQASSPPAEGDGTAPNLEDIVSKIQQLKNMAPLITGQAPPGEQNDDNA